MKKSLAPLLILLFIISLVVFPPAAVKAEFRTIVVPDDYPTISSAISKALDGDTIFVKKGVYVENPVINKSISLIGENRDTTVIDVTAGLKVQKDGVTITGLTIYDGYDGISLAANYCNISKNKITNTTHGIVVFGYENSISDNIFESIGLSSAIQLNFANRNLINNNYIVSCVEGIQVWQNSINNTITENTITNCQDTAINFQYSNDNVIVGNNISHSGLGTSIYASNRNVISNNNYVNNTSQFGANEWYYLTWGGNHSINTINENYWSDYNGTDANGDGIGDIPYIIDANNADHYPLMKPVAIPGLSDETRSIPELVDGAGYNGTDKTEHFSTLLVVFVTVAAVVVVAVGVLVYFKERKYQSE
jgi:nitrous oxidase accessory protein NosD